MELTISNTKTKTILLDIFALLAITLTPALSHLLALPIYLLEPMRIMLVLSIIHTSKKNSYAIALMLPIFSFLISAHPSIIKTLLISSELILNVWLFNLVLNNIRNVFVSMIAGILISKVFYYSIKFGLMSIGLLSGDLAATPIYLQFVIALVLSTYSYFMFKGSSKA